MRPRSGAALSVAVALALVPCTGPGRAEATHTQASMVRAYERYRARLTKQRERAVVAVAVAMRQRGKPYRWAAAGPSSFDCSGLAMWSWGHAGVRLSHRAADQYRQSPRKVGRADLEPGDLVFFHGFGHVVLWLGRGRYVHAPHTGDVVRVARFDRHRATQWDGAVRPGAPALKRWPRWVRELAAHPPAPARHVVTHGGDGVGGIPLAAPHKARRPGRFLRAKVSAS